MSNSTTLICASIADLCASFQPNSHLWQIPTGLRGQAGVKAGSFSVALRQAGKFGPSGSTAPVYMARTINPLFRITGLGIANEMRPQAAMPGIAMMGMEVELPNSDSETGTISTFNKTNIGSHSRLSGEPSHQKAVHAPPHWHEPPNPGGGSTA